MPETAKNSVNPRIAEPQPRRAQVRAILSGLVALAVIIALPLIDAGAAENVTDRAHDRVVLMSVADSDLASELERLFSLPLHLAIPGTTEAEREGYIEREIRRLAAHMRERGYLDATVQRDGDLAKGSLRLRPVPGALYRVGWIRIAGLPQVSSTALRNTLDDFVNERVGRVATADIIEDIEDGVLWRLREAAFANAKVSDISLSAEPATRTAGVSVSVQPGAAVRFGEVRFEPTVRMTDDELAGLVTFAPGDPYSISAIAELTRQLQETGKFRRVRVELAEALDADGRTDILVELRDAPRPPATLAPEIALGPALLVATMLLLVFREYARATPAWRSPALRRVLTAAVLAMVVVSGAVIAHRVASFLT